MSDAGRGSDAYVTQITTLEHATNSIACSNVVICVTYVANPMNHTGRCIVVSRDTVKRIAERGECHVIVFYSKTRLALFMLASLAVRYSRDTAHCTRRDDQD